MMLGSIHGTFASRFPLSESRRLIHAAPGPRQRDPGAAVKKAARLRLYARRSFQMSSKGIVSVPRRRRRRSGSMAFTTPARVL